MNLRGYLMMSSMWEHYELERVSNDVINVGAL